MKKMEKIREENGKTGEVTDGRKLCSLRQINSCDDGELDGDGRCMEY